MAVTIDKVKIQTYENNVRFLAQQGISRLRPYVMERQVHSEAHNWERLAQSTANIKTRSQATPNGETVWSRRQSVPTPYNVGDIAENSDKVQMAIEPNSSYAFSHAMAMRRAHDAAIIEAAVGDSRDGDGNVVAYDAGQLVGDGSAPISYDMVTAVTEKFLEKDIDPSERKIFVIGPKQQRKLLQLTEATSRDYNTMDALRAGYVDNWMGYTWIVSTLLQAPAAGQLDCFAMTEKGVGLQMNQDIFARIQEDPSLSFAWRIYCESTFGAIRVEDEHVVKAHVADTV
jgi:hypothetical protein